MTSRSTSSPAAEGKRGVCRGDAGGGGGPRAEHTDASDPARVGQQIARGGIEAWLLEAADRNLGRVDKGDVDERPDLTQRLLPPHAAAAAARREDGARLARPEVALRRHAGGPIDGILQRRRDRVVVLWAGKEHRVGRADGGAPAADGSSCRSARLVEVLRVERQVACSHRAAVRRLDCGPPAGRRAASVPMVARRSSTPRCRAATAATRSKPALVEAARSEPQTPKSTSGGEASGSGSVFGGAEAGAAAGGLAASGLRFCGRCSERRA